MKGSKDRWSKAVQNNVKPGKAKEFKMRQNKAKGNVVKLSRVE